MTASAAIADSLLRRALGRRARPSDPPRTARVRIGSSRLRAPVSRHGSAISRRTVINHAGRRSTWLVPRSSCRCKESSFYPPPRLAVPFLATYVAIRGPFNRTAAARRRRSGIDVRRSVQARLGTELVSLPKQLAAGTVGLERRSSVGLVIPLSHAPWHFLYFFPLPQGQGSLRPTLFSKLLSAAK